MITELATVLILLFAFVTANPVVPFDSKYLRRVQETSQHPNWEAICQNLFAENHEAIGLCVAYAKKDCTDEADPTKKSCDQIKENFERITGGAVLPSDSCLCMTGLEGFADALSAILSCNTCERCFVDADSFDSSQPQLAIFQGVNAAPESQILIQVSRMATNHRSCLFNYHDGEDVGWLDESTDPQLSMGQALHCISFLYSLAISNDIPYCATQPL